MSGLFARPRFAVALPFAYVLLALPLAATAQIEEIVVTARKTGENLQDVPISITAFGEQQLKGLGLQSDNDVADFTVNFNTLQQTGRGYDRPVIRGMAAPPSRGEANAGYFIDGIYVSGTIAGATTSTVERVEVLRGPQSAQFGRATFSGAVNYVTKNPTEVLTGEINTRAGTHDDYLVGGWVSGPLIEDRLSFVLSANWNKYGGQWHNNLQQDQAFAQPNVILLQPGTAPQQADHSRLGSEDTQDYLAKLVWTPWEGGEFNFKYGYNLTEDSTFPSLVALPAEPIPPVPTSSPQSGLADAHGGPVGIYNTLNCWLPPTGQTPLPPGAPPPGQPSWWSTSGGAICGRLEVGNWENRINIPDFESGVTMSNGRYVPPADPGQHVSQNRYLLNFSQEFSNDWLLTFRGGYNREDFTQRFDLDHTETRAVFGLFNFDVYREGEDWSSEFRLASPRDLPVRGEVGTYYYDRHVENSQRSIPGPTLYFGNANTPEFGPETEKDVKNVAFFGTFGWDITDQWTFDLEGRYASEDVDVFGGNGCDSLSTYYNFTPRVSLTWKPTDELRFYGQVANGDKPGDVNTEFMRADVPVDVCQAAQVETTDVTVRPEEQWTYELGMKSQWFDQRFQANLAIFMIDWSDQSIFQTVDFGAYPFAPPSLNLVTTILRNVGDSRNYGGELETQLSVTDELTLIANYGYTHAKFRSGTSSELANLTGDGDVSGQWIPSAPEHNYVLGLIVSKPLTAESTFTFRTDMSYESKRYIDPANFSYIGPRTLVNMRAGVDTGPWTVTGYVRNLMDDDTPVAGLTFVNFGYGAIAPGPDTVYGTNDDIFPNMISLNPQRGRDYGLEVVYRFGG